MQENHDYRKSSIQPLGSYLFQTHLIRGLIEMGGLFNLTKYNHLWYQFSIKN